MALQPFLDLRMFMGGVIVSNDVDVQFSRALLIDQFEKGEPFLMTMARRQAGDQLAFEVIERGGTKSTCRAARNHGSWYECARCPAADLAACARALGIAISRRSTTPAPCRAGRDRAR